MSGPRTELGQRIAAKYKAQEKEMARQKTPEKEREESILSPREAEAEAWIAEKNEELVLAAERQAVEAIKPYWEAQQAESRFRQDKEAYGTVIKAYLQIEGMSELVDVEAGFRAVLQTRSDGKDNWDVGSMPDELILRLAKAGCLVADKAAMNLKSHQALRMDAERWHIPAGETVALRVTKDE